MDRRRGTQCTYKLDLARFSDYKFRYASGGRKSSAPKVPNELNLALLPAITILCRNKNCETWGSLNSELLLQFLQLYR
ncbi:hypothetical protein TNCV_4571911 [Trichonephila clavipes]|nr:hypothetical protein TNCV_4571911 [Trichonephila clavipes]